ncbi:RICIN domain-containing protein [Streptomyces sp. NPDC005209]|uniref:RICIN domain-containing protein n=1 Tax=Streptomyces sp. NPDC005209 TaxID=3156715 RepID=UPI0033AFA98E
MAGFGAADDSQAPHITASHGGVAVGHADQVTYIRKQRARRLRLLVVPVVVAGGTITVITLVPDSSPSGPERSFPAPSVSASTLPSGSPSAARSPSRPAARASGNAAAVTQPVQTGAGNPPEAAPPPSAESEATTLSPGSVSRLRNVSTGQCVSSGDGTVNPGLGTCSSSDAYLWTLRSSGSTFELVNRASGNCLSEPFYGNAAVLENCSGIGGTGHVEWRIGSNTAGGQTLKNTESGRCLEIDSPPDGGGEQLMLTTCNSDQPQQRWKNGGTA